MLTDLLWGGVSKSSGVEEPPNHQLMRVKLEQCYLAEAISLRRLLGLVAAPTAPYFVMY